jgi:transposase
MSELVSDPTATVQPGRRACSRAFTREVWLDRLARFPLSGLTPAQFCAVEGISLPSFYAWKRRLAAEALGTATDKPQTDNPAPRLLPVSLPQPAVVLEVVLPAGPVLRIPPGCDPAWVRSLVCALGDTSC